MTDREMRATILGLLLVERDGLTGAVIAQHVGAQHSNAVYFALGSLYRAREIEVDWVHSADPGWSTFTIPVVDGDVTP